MNELHLWDRLDAELTHWQQDGLTAWFWWRDDDAVEVTPALDQLLDLQQRTGVPLTIAVIPAQATEMLADRLREAAGICAVQHGFSHQNHSSAKKSEFPSTRPAAACLTDLTAGRMRMQRLFGATFDPLLLVPPWNRISTDLLPDLPQCGFTALSTYQARAAYWAVPGLARLNTHLDPVDWRNGRSGHGIAACLDTARVLLEQLRTQKIPLQPLGLLSHHLRHDGAGWGFLADFLTRTTQHPAVRWISARKALEIGKPPAAVMPSS